MMGTHQLKIGLRVSDLHRSAKLYRAAGCREIPNQDQPNLRYLTFGHTWLILTDLHAHGFHSEERAQAARGGPLGSGVVLAIPTSDLEAMHRLWRAEELPITLAPEDAGWARIFYGLDPDGYEVMFEQFAN
ncbi:VOC family protein [Pseudonocardia sp. McavD-2-B]|uniref:VOC family protein n=1 Tax=Pseudonocardia sp. McavD-2-B TaxID=2954499 RepID=UPI002096C230|nr:VOC family protein [Pseudonocardia sp. McavD-2-B]MCO7195150.1 VOC family protein [Pseudonocardia sp. McavD-2-B]